MRNKIIKYTALVFSTVILFCDLGFAQHADDMYWPKTEFKSNFFDSHLTSLSKKVEEIPNSSVVTGINTQVKEYEVETGSKDNIIELALNNLSNDELNNVSIAVSEKPSWIDFEEDAFQIITIPAKSTKTISLAFSVSAQFIDDISEIISITAITGDKKIWEKQLSVKPKIPLEFKLFDNYPNPFNPSTNIQYSLPEKGNVTLEIFNILGQRVTVLVDEVQTAGSYTKTWNAANVASGMYLYRMSVSGESGKKFFQNKKMLLIK